MDRTEGFGVYIDRTLKKVQSTFLQDYYTNPEIVNRKLDKITFGKLN